MFTSFRLRIIYLSISLVVFSLCVRAQEWQRLYGGKNADTTAAIQIFTPDAGKATGTGLLIFPGGGYGFLSLIDEGENIAKAFTQKGITCFVVRYRLPDGAKTKRSDTLPLSDAVAAMRWVKKRASNYQLDTAKIGCIGFSAGGHLASTFSNHAPLDARPAFSLLVYPVVTMQPPFVHMGSRENLLGKQPSTDLVNYYSGELQVNDHTPPTYITHTGDDGLVPVQNSIELYKALQQQKINAALHILPYGDHGFIFGIPVSEWRDPMLLWLQQSRFYMPISDQQKTVVLTFDDAIASHYSVAAPLLKQYGFGATFYVCEFPPDFADSSKYLNWRQMQAISRMGFDIGNHTGHHTGVRDVDSVTLLKEVRFIEDKCASLGIPKPVTFAYPGCGSSPVAANLLHDQGYLAARTCEERCYRPGKDDAMQLPSFPIQGSDMALFYKALRQQKEGEVLVLLFHGVPDNAHSWVNTPEILFKQYMQYLHDNNYRVISMRELMQPKY